VGCFFASSSFFFSLLSFLASFQLEITSHDERVLQQSSTDSTSWST
jgi:hypothetical protein